MAKPEQSNVVELDTVRAQLDNARAENAMLHASVAELRSMLEAMQAAAAAPPPVPVPVPAPVQVAQQPAPALVAAVAPTAPAGDVLATLQAIERHALVQARALALIQRALDLLMQMAAAQLERGRAGE
jgi:hypothetical protein